MSLLSLVPFLFAYLVSGRLLKEKNLFLRLTVSYALGVSSCLFMVNILFHFYPLKTSLYIALSIMGLLSFLILFLKPVRPLCERFTQVEIAGLIFFCVTTVIYLLLWQMRYSDDDFWMHGPLMALYLKDNFPPMNPYFPDMPYTGHYGRDLTISSFSVFFRGRFLEVQYVLTAMNHAATFLLGYFTAKKYMRKTTPALLGMLFVFLGIQSSARTGLLETFQNNNTFVYLMLFLNIYLYLNALTRRDIASKIISALFLGLYALVYETHYGILLITFSVFPLALSLLRRRWKPRYFAITGFILAASLVLAVFQGGTLTDMRKRHFSSDAEIAKSADTQTASQQASIKFPKKGLKITSPNSSKEYFVLSGMTVKETGLFVGFLPLTLFLVAYGKNYWSLIFGIISIVSILVPATVDFGKFNAESLRFLFFAGISAAMVFGVSLGIVFDRLRTKVNPKLLYTALSVILVLSFYKAVYMPAFMFRDAARYPEKYYLNTERWAGNYLSFITNDRLVPIIGPIAPIDVRTAKKIQPLIKKGDRLLAHFLIQNMHSVKDANSILSTFTGAYVPGLGLKTSKDDSLTVENYLNWSGYRTEAFWHTLDMGILDDMGIDYLYINPGNFTPVEHEKIRGSERLELIHREEAENGLLAREVYRVKRAETRSFSIPPDLTVASAEFPSDMKPFSFYEVPLSFGCKAPGDIRMLHKIRYKNKVMNAGDEISHVVKLRPEGKNRCSGSFHFVTPYEDGPYDIEFYGLDGSGYKPLKDRENKNAVIRINVTAPSDME